MEKITISNEEIFSLLKKNKFVVSKLLLGKIFEKHQKDMGKKLKLPVNKKVESLIINQFINVYKGSFIYLFKI